MSISYAGHEYTVCWRSAVGQVSRQPAIEVLRGFSWPKILLKFDAISATRSVTLLDIVVTRRNLV